MKFFRKLFVPNFFIVKIWKYLCYETSGVLEKVLKVRNFYLGDTLT